MDELAVVKVLLRGDHPWSGNVGVVIADDNIGRKVKLDNGMEVYAFDGQWREITDN